MGRNNSSEARARIAVEAARIVTEQGIEDYGRAKRKAAQRLGLGEYGPLPRNSEVEAAVLAQHRLFGGDAHHRELRAQRLLALNLMRTLEEFHPRLAGQVLSGTATRHTPVQIHLFADHAEAVAFSLMERGVRYRSWERRLRTGNGAVHAVPGYRFHSDGFEVELLVFPEVGRREAPVSPIDGRPMQRAGADEVAALL